MRKPRACCPTVQALEERVVLSLSFSKLIHSLFPFIKTNDKTAVPHRPHVAAHVVRPHAGLAHPGAPAVAGTGTASGAAAVVGARRAARRLAMANAAANATNSTPTPTDPTAKGSVPVYGPYLGPPGSYHRIPPRIVRAARPPV
jgi:hypothetical protein